MNRLLGVINLDHEGDFLNELTYFRCGASVPYAGRYRLIDFVISSMTNSGIFEVAVFVRSKYRSLMDHMGEGKQWNFDKKQGGLFILPPDWHDPGDISQGDLRYFHNNMDFFRRGSSKYVLHTGSQHIANIDFEEVFQQHLETKADVTFIYKNVDRLQKEHQSCLKLEVDEQNNVKNVSNAPDNPNVYMNMFIINKDLLIDLVQDCIAHHKGYFFRDGILANLENLDVKAYSYQGYHAVINSIESYFENSMNLLDINHYQDLFLKNNKIYTKVKDEIPTKYHDISRVKNSLVANGCDIQGQVKNSIIFRDVNVEKGAQIENSIVMARGNIRKDSYLKNVILDKEVEVSSGQDIIGSPQKPFVVAKRKNI